MTIRNRLTVAAAVAALVPLGAAVAGDNDQYGTKHDKMSHESFRKLDTNKDGRISQAEAAADSTIVFSSADTNGDGYLDKDELKAANKSSSGSNSSQSQSSSSSQSIPSSQSPESSSPNSDSTPSTTDPNQNAGEMPSGNRSPDTQNPPQ